MFFRDKQVDIGVLYSLKKDLERFWQSKTFRWERLLRRHAIIQETGVRTMHEETEDPRLTGQALLEAQEDYITLCKRIVDQREHALEVVSFLGIDPPKHLSSLTFTPFLPENSNIEAAIDEVAVLAHYVTYLNYPAQTLRYFLYATYDWMKALISKR